MSKTDATPVTCAACGGKRRLRLLAMDAEGPCERMRKCHDCDGRGVIYPGLMGKRALVLGVPFKDGKAELLLFHKANDALDFAIAHIVPGAPRHQVIAWLLEYDAEIAVCVNGRYMRAARSAAAWVGIPVLRVRRDGAIEVEAGDG